MDPILSDDEIDARLDEVLRASGSRLRYYTMPKVLAEMRSAMRAVESAALANLAAQPAKASDEPNWQHPKLQALLSERARLSIRLSMLEQMLDDPDAEFGSMDMEHWNTLHDKVCVLLNSQVRPPPDPGPWPATGLEPRGCPTPGACSCPAQDDGGS